MADAENPLSGAHTPADEQPGGEDEALGLLDVAGSPDALSLDVLGAAAELVAAQRRARGRPKGSGNKRNGDMLRYLQNLGHRDPLVTLSMIQTADTKALAKTLCADAIDVFKVQAAAARDMLPYLYAKKPQQLELPAGDRVPLMVIGGDLNVTKITNATFDSAGELPEEYQALIDGESVRHQGDKSHDDE